ncbi:CHAD domain-containing protein [Microlunatus soli]|uniref:CHAD domain-containing protein n=1 Tax=Microlunatus soli TaxID=630515 RepID=A0A1H1MD72_9ACTN|nr:CHAD domain-containing protein [Microlunatus soli]SDR84305.1 CHAD domain-containing protein [Microlunatus soli]
MSKKTNGPTVADVLGPYLIEQCAAVQAVGADLQAALQDDLEPALSAERIHDGRSGCRRIRSIVKVYEEFFSVPESGRLSDDAGWFASRMGAVRDLDVLGERLTRSMDRLDADLILHDARQELIIQIGYRRQIALAELRDAVHSEPYADLLDQLAAWQRKPAFVPDASKPATKIKKFLKRSESKLGRRLRTAALAIAADDPESDELIHTARRVGKRHRYAVEAAAPVLGPSADRLVELHQQFTDELGEYQDSRVASVLLRDLGGIPGRNGFTFGVLHAQETALRRRLAKRIAKRAHGL